MISWSDLYRCSEGFKLSKTDYLIHLQDKIGHSSKKIGQSQQYFRILTLEN
jgi:hypothetical protein